MSIEHRLRSTVAAVASLVLAVGLVPRPASAQYKITKLTSNLSGIATATDSNLVNAWGLTFAPGGPFWISANGTGVSTIYNSQGATQFGPIAVPPAAGNSTGSPTGIVYNASSEFVVSQNGLSGSAIFLFDTLDGTISGWSPSVNSASAVIAVDNSSTGAVYTGLAIATTSSGSFLYAADNKNDWVAMYDGSFNLVQLITDSTIPSTFTPFGVQNINNQIYVTYANVTGGGGGYVDIFDTSGTFVSRFTSGTPLNQPWGVALAPSNFGQASNEILIGNNIPTGTINAFNATSGKVTGALRGSNGQPLEINQLWAIAFGGGSSSDGATNQLFFTAGPKNFSDGLFGVINSK